MTIPLILDVDTGIDDSLALLFRQQGQQTVNAGGGLIADGHPVGATGVRQVFEAYQQLTEQAGARQIENTKKFLTFNMGGSLTTSVAMVWGRE